LTRTALANSLVDAKHWRCTACIQNDLHEEEEDDDDDDDELEAEEQSKSLTRRRLSSVPKLARDLLPSHRGAATTGHSIFNELILPDDPPDGARSLRKRKASNEEDAPPTIKQTRKKRRPSEISRSEAGPSVTTSSPHAVPSNAITEADESEGEGDAQQNESDHDSTRLRSSRARRSKPPQKKDKRPLVWIEESQGLSLIIAFHLNNESVQKIVTSKPKKKTLTLEQERQERRRERDRERRERNRRAAQAARESPELAQYPSIQSHYTPFPGFLEKEDESKSKPYGGILSEADADTSKTYPTAADRKRFEDARVKAEQAWKEKQTALYSHHEVPRASKQAATASKIKCVSFGGWEIDTWHAAPYPEEYSKNRVLYICEFCLKYMNSDYVAWRHKVRKSGFLSTRIC
jgi:histone acetyltransferase SAS3